MAAHLLAFHLAGPRDSAAISDAAAFRLACADCLCGAARGQKAGKIAALWGGSHAQPAPKWSYRCRAAEGIGERTLAYLAKQRLPATPQNYALAYLTLADPSLPVTRAANAITEGGVRIRQEEADEIINLYAGAVVHARPLGAGEDGRDALRHQTLMLGDVASSAAAVTGAFSRDLSAQLEALAGDSTRAVQIVARMIERSRAAENELQVAARQVEAEVAP